MPRGPRTDPYGRNYRIRLLPRVLGVESLVGIRVQYPGTGDPFVDEWAEACPRQSMLVAPASQREEPVTYRLRTERHHAGHVVWHRVVVEVAPNHRRQPLGLPCHRFVSATHQRTSHLPELGRQPFAHCLAFDRELPVGPLSPTDVGEPQEVEGLRLTLAPSLSVLGGEPPELDQPGQSQGAAPHRTYPIVP